MNPMYGYISRSLSPGRLWLLRLAVCFFLVLNSSAISLAQRQVFEPTSSFTARLIGSANVLVAAPSGTEGTEWRSGFLDIKEGTSDRVVLEYDLRGQTTTDSAVLELELTNLDVPNSTTIFMYSFEANGLANAADYFRTDNFVTTFTDNGLASNFIPPYHIPFSFDITSIYNSAISNGDDYLGILLKNTTDEAEYARYRLTKFGGRPKLIVGVPEPNSLWLASIGMVFLMIRRRTV